MLLIAACECKHQLVHSHNNTITSKWRSNRASKFRRWHRIKITSDMLDCCAKNLILEANSSSEVPFNFKKIAWIKISEGNVTIVHHDPNLHSPRHDTALSRMEAIEFGIKSAINYALQNFNMTSFPNLEALFFPCDEARLIRPLQSRCACGNSTFPWPPIFAQNREYRHGNVFITLPDFSFFTDFSHSGNHGTNADVWFDVVRNEIKRNESTVFNPVPYDSKDYDRAIWRGTVNRRLWGRTRSALWGCKGTEDVLDTLALPVTKPEMCKMFKMIVTIPGNGVWSWATKFNLVSHRYPCKFQCTPRHVLFPVVVQFCDHTNQGRRHQWRELGNQAGFEAERKFPLRGTWGRSQHNLS